MASDGLRLMIYDDTDLDTAFRYLKEFTPPNMDSLDELIDVVDLDMGLTHAWRFGRWWYTKTGRFDYSKGFKSWADALQWLTEIEPDAPIAEIQFWGHGSPGKAWIAGEPLHHRSYVGDKHGPLLKQIKTRLLPDSVIWFRTCSTFCGTRGHQFAKAFSRDMGCIVAAHTHVIGAWQAGLHTIRPGEEPSWHLKEGIAAGSVDKPTEGVWSRMWSPNSIFFVRSRIPKGW